MPPEQTWDYAWHDIWPTIPADNISSMDTLTARYADRIPVQHCWQRDRCERMLAVDIEFWAAREAGDWARVKELDPDF